VFDFSNIQLEGLALHLVGNKAREEGTRAGKELLRFESEDDRFRMMDFFLGSFKLEETFRFDHETDLDMNEVFAYCSYIFEDPSQLYDQSVNLLRHLYEKSGHPNVKAGELYVAFFRDVLVGDELVEAVGIFKSERKDTFLQLRADDDRFQLDFFEGTQLNKLDKGALVLNSYREEGYRVLCVDLKSADARYWRDEFLMVTQIPDNAFHTKNHLALCKDFVQEVYSREASKKEQVDFVNKSLDYFNSHETFDFNEFKQEITGGDETKAQRFETYAKTYREDTGMGAEDQFFISPKAVKQMKRKLNNVIKLDTQVEIRLAGSGGEEFVERGFDAERNMHYYKVFFNQED
jgi:hypothetical protein